MREVNRRTFLSSAAGAAAVSGLAVRPAGAGPNDTVRTAVLGLNGRGTTHVDGFMSTPGVKVAVLCDPDRVVLDRRAREFEKRYGTKVETETDLLGYLRFLPARQDDTDRLRLWEVAGAAHADRSIIGEFEELLGCSDPVNRGQQRFVVRSALRHLDEWVEGTSVPPSAERIAVTDVDGAAEFLTDDIGNAIGGVRTPCVEVPVEVLSGLAAPGSSRICQLFGRTIPVPEATLRERYASAEAYRQRYEAAVDAAIDAGFALVEDRNELLADARPDLIGWLP